MGYLFKSSESRRTTLEGDPTLKLSRLLLTAACQRRRRRHPRGRLQGPRCSAATAEPLDESLDEVAGNLV